MIRLESGNNAGGDRERCLREVEFATSTSTRARLAGVCLRFPSFGADHSRWSPRRATRSMPTKSGSRDTRELSLISHHVFAPSRRGIAVVSVVFILPAGNCSVVTDLRYRNYGSQYIRGPILRRDSDLPVNFCKNTSHSNQNSLHLPVIARPLLPCKLPEPMDCLDRRPLQ